MKRSGRDEPMWVVIYMSMEITQGISLRSYLYQTSKNTISFSLSLMLSLQQNWPTRGWNGGGGLEGKVIQAMYTHVSKCKINKRNII
jgi:hypothetical protein